MLDDETGENNEIAERLIYKGFPVMRCYGIKRQIEGGSGHHQKHASRFNLSSNAITGAVNYFVDAPLVGLRWSVRICK